LARGDHFLQGKNGMVGQTILYGMLQKAGEELGIKAVQAYALYDLHEE